MKEDFNFLSETFARFFSRKTMKDTMLAISEYELSGWEKWLQIEFAKFCRDNDEVAHWNREYRYLIDRRINRNKTACDIDFVLRQKNKHSVMAIEFKQINSPGQCIKAMISDIKKLHCIRDSENDLRSIWCLGVHHEVSGKTVEAHVLKFAKQADVEISLDLLETKRIGRTDFSYTMF